MSCPRQLRPICRRSAYVSACHPETDGGRTGYLRSWGGLLLESDGAEAPPVVPPCGQGPLRAAKPHGGVISSGSRRTLFLFDYSVDLARSQIHHCAARWRLRWPQPFIGARRKQARRLTLALARFQRLGQACMRAMSSRTLASNAFSSNRCFTRSPMLTIPTRWPLSITGRWRIFPRVMAAIAVSTRSVERQLMIGALIRRST